MTDSDFFFCIFQEDGDLHIIPVVEYCISNTMTVWLALIYAYKGLLLVGLIIISTTVTRTQ